MGGGRRVGWGGGSRWGNLGWWGGGLESRTQTEETAHPWELRI